MFGDCKLMMVCDVPSLCLCFVCLYNSLQLDYLFRNEMLLEDIEGVACLYVCVFCVCGICVLRVCVCGARVCYVCVVCVV